jgi:hypothetical protein
MPRPRELSPAIVEAALHGLEAQPQRLDSQIADGPQVPGGGPEPATPADQLHRSFRTPTVLLYPGAWSHSVKIHRRES